MNSAISRVTSRAGLLAALAVASMTVAASPSQARVFIGIGVPPPVYYTPPPAQSAAAPAYSPAPSGEGQSCYAGPYVCPMDRPVASGGPCYCIGNGGQRVSGRAN